MMCRLGHRHLEGRHEHYEKLVVVVVGRAVVGEEAADWNVYFHRVLIVDWRQVYYSVRFQWRGLAGEVVAQTAQEAHVR